MLLLLFKVDVHESSARVTVFPLLAFHVCFLWTMGPKPRLRSSSRVSYFRLWFKDNFDACFQKLHASLLIFSPSFLIGKLYKLSFSSHLSKRKKISHIKITDSIRFSLLVSIDRFYKALFRAEGVFVNRQREDLPRSLSSRQYPIRLAPLATFPTRGRLCPSVLFFPRFLYSL